MRLVLDFISGGWQIVWSLFYHEKCCMLKILYFIFTSIFTSVKLYFHCAAFTWYINNLFFLCCDLTRRYRTTAIKLENIKWKNKRKKVEKARKTHKNRKCLEQQRNQRKDQIKTILSVKKETLLRTCERFVLHWNHILTISSSTRIKLLNCYVFVLILKSDLMQCVIIFAL